MRQSCGTPAQIARMAKALYKEERARKKLDDWFGLREIRMNRESEYQDLPPVEREAKLLTSVVLDIPLEIGAKQIFAGSQHCAFSRVRPSHAPGLYAACPLKDYSPMEAYYDITPGENRTRARIGQVRFDEESEAYEQALSAAMNDAKPFTDSGAFYVEPSTGRVVPDFGYVLKNGIGAALTQARERLRDEQNDWVKRSSYRAAIFSLESVLVLAGRYMAVAIDAEAEATGVRKNQMALLRRTLAKVPEKGAETLYEAIQSFILIWQIMAIEQMPDPVAFSAGCIDRLFEPYRAQENLPRDQATALFEHLLVFFNPGADGWAISQGVTVGGRDASGSDLTNECTYALLDAFYEMNLPQPLLSVRLHKNTPDALYRALGRFFFTPGHATPALFCDERVFETLERDGVGMSDVSTYGVVGDELPAVTGKDDGGSACAYLNLTALLAAALEGGADGARNRFYDKLEGALDALTAFSSDCASARAQRPTPFLSTLMGGLTVGYDLRDETRRLTPYTGGALWVGGLENAADSLSSLARQSVDQPDTNERLFSALDADFKGYESLRAQLLACPKIARGERDALDEATKIVRCVHRLTAQGRYRLVFSTAAPGALYGGAKATPDGRGAEDVYALDDAPGALLAFNPTLTRVLGGLTRHVQIDVEEYSGADDGEKCLLLKERVLTPLFYGGDAAPWRVCVNAVTPAMIRQAAKAMSKYAPDGVFLLRVPGAIINLAQQTDDALSTLAHQMETNNV